MHVTSMTNPLSAAEQIDTRHGSASGLVNSSGVIRQRMPSGNLSMKDLDRVVDIDPRGTNLCFAVFGSRTAERGHGAIVNIASITGSCSMPLHTYAPAKEAVISITQCLAAEWGRSGVRVNSVSPGYTLTPALQAAIGGSDRNPASLVSHAAMGGMVMPEEVAHSVGFLLSLQASAITGIDPPVDAGWLVGTSWLTYGGIPEPRHPANESSGAR